MSRNLRALASALMALLAMGIATSSASAAVEFHVETLPAGLKGTQEGSNVFVTDSGTIHCTTATISGTQSAATAAAVEVSPTYSGCESTGFIKSNVTVDMNGCKYNLTAAASTQMVHITGCNAGAAGIVMTAPFCMITLTPQTIGPVDYETAGSAGTTHEVVINSTVANLGYHESGPACAHSGSTTTGGQYAGKIRVTAHHLLEGAPHIGLTVE